jgi:hypothetical protein
MAQAPLCQVKVMRGFVKVCGEGVPEGVEGAVYSIAASVSTTRITTGRLFPTLFHTGINFRFRPSAFHQNAATIRFFSYNIMAWVMLSFLTKRSRHENICNRYK